MLVYAKCLTGNKDGSTGSKGDITSSVSDSSSSHCCCRIVTGTCYDFHCFREAQFFCHFRQNCSYNFITFKDLWYLRFSDTTDIQHFFRPAFILYIKDQHTGCIGYICAVYTRQLKCNVVLWQHDHFGSCKILRFLFLHPEDLRSGKSCKCNVGCILGQCLFSDHIIQIICLLLGTSIIPQNCRTDNVIIFIQSNHSMHLSTKTDTCNLALITIFCQFL